MRVWNRSRMHSRTEEFLLRGSIRECLTERDTDKTKKVRTY